MPVLDEDGVAHYGYIINDGRGNPHYVVAACYYALILSGQGNLLDPEGQQRRWRLDDAVRSPVDCLQCLGMNSNFIRAAEDRFQ